jgi:hypothetical protein
MLVRQALEPLQQPFFAVIMFFDGVSLTFFAGAGLGLQFSVSASRVAGIVVMSHCAWLCTNFSVISYPMIII